MRIKVDENIGSSGVDILRRDGHDVTTVREQGLAGSSGELWIVEPGRVRVRLEKDDE